MTWYVIRLSNGFYVGWSGLAQNVSDARRFMTRRSTLCDASAIHGPTARVLQVTLSP